MSSQGSSGDDELRPPPPSREARVWVFVGILTCAGVALTMLGVSRLDPVQRPFDIPWVLIAAGYYVTESAVLHLRFRGQAFSVSMAEFPLILGLFFMDPLPLVALAVVAEAAALVLQRRQVPVKAAFNVAGSLFELGLAILVFYAVVPSPPVGPWAWTAAFAGALVSSFVSGLLVSIVISLATGDWHARRYVEDALFSLISTFATTCLAILAVELAKTEPVSLILLVVPLVVVYAGYRSLVTRDDQRRRAQEEITRSREQLQAILDHSPSAIYIKDASGVYLLVNAKFEAMVGKPSTEIVGRSDLELFHESIALPLLENDRKVLASKLPISVEERLPDPEEGERVYLSVKFPLLSSSDGSLDVCGISSDVTVHKQLEDRLRQGEKMQAIGHLAGGIAHDFNNLLAVIRNYAEFIDADVQESEGVHADIRAIINASDRAADLSRQLLAFARRDLVMPVVLDINSVVSEMEKMLGRTLGENIRLATKLGTDLPSVRMDPGQLEQILMNLAVNARDAMPHGGELVIATDAEIRESSQDMQGGDFVVLEVTDTGTGMSPEVQAAAFEPFFTTKAIGKGTGLGLATVYGIVQQVGGSVELESSEGQGTKVRICIPATDEEPAAVVPATRSVPSGGELILVVEDERAVRALVARILTRSGYEVLTAASGEEALALLRSSDRPIDLLLTDVVLPNMSGDELAAEAHVETLFMSGYPDTAAIAPGRGLPPDALLIRKPFSHDQLLEQVARALDHKSSAGKYPSN